MSDLLLLQVRESVSLTGLGILLLPAAEAPGLNRFPLHTALHLHLRYPSGLAENAVASVEEITRPNSEVGLSAAERVLMLTQEGAIAPPVGTQVWWTGEEANWW
ncbi:hypothetical protein [Hymenobacter fodinae]|uniref:Uncharacterized protein n=1 Tax=Hymenobacter fodinae TaxID=2510796 RepID=A0A4Z0P794_9BACT|nr:hypothetical protein [Hymenobacter fodinae]TGE07818.1 hypothetical protein EU556_08685 [Hymenobacter fodinae]